VLSRNDGVNRLGLVLRQHAFTCPEETLAKLEHWACPWPFQGDAMLKPFVFAAALTVGCSTMTAATPIPSSRAMVADTISVSRVKYTRDSGYSRSPYRNSVIALSMGLLVSLIAAAIATD